MNNLISGKEAKLAWANGEELEFYSPDLDVWFGLNDEPFMSDVFDTRPIRLKPCTITINRIEVPAPFEPNEFEDCYMLTDLYEHGYTKTSWKYCKQVPAWRNENEVKQVVKALRSVFKVD